MFLPEDKIQKILEFAIKIENSKKIRIRELAKFIGLVIHAFFAVTAAPLHYRNLERDKTSNLKMNNGNYDKFMTLSNGSKEEIHWWIDNIRVQNGKPIRIKPVDYWIETDASKEGMGARFFHNHFNKKWKTEEKDFHINHLELLAIKLAILHFCKDMSNVHIGIKTDNTTALSYVNNMGGMVSLGMDSLAKEIWSWCLDRNIWLTCQYLPGSLNEVADFLSRNFTNCGEWNLKPEIFQRVVKQLFAPEVDLFASENNFKVNKFVSRYFCEKAWKTDAFTFSWHNLRPYIFPPICLISRIINKIIEDRVEQSIIIFPLWQTQSWFSLLLSRIISIPIRLPKHKDLITTGESRQPIQSKVTLVAAAISGKEQRVMDFQRKLDLCFFQPGDNPPLNNTTLRGSSSILGVIKGREIPIVSLKKI